MWSFWDATSSVDHYHLTVLSDWDENVFVDTNDVWDDGDRVGITIPPDGIRVIKN